jgi:MoxR-like ATPase
MLPALQARAALYGRDFVSAEDIEALAPRVFNHRLELVPGLADPERVIREALARAIETLSRSTLRR